MDRSYNEKRYVDNGGIRSVKYRGKNYGRDGPNSIHAIIIDARFVDNFFTFKTYRFDRIVVVFCRPIN